MTIVNIGVSHRFAPAEILEKLTVPSAELGSVLTRLHTVPSIDEVAVLSTCNRVEVYAATSGPAEQVTRAVASLVAARARSRSARSCGWPESGSAARPPSICSPWPAARFDGHR